MKKVKFNVQEPYLSFIKSGEKTVEGRLNKGKFQALKNGDILVLGDSSIELEVIDKRHYTSFAELITAEGIDRVVPDKTSVEAATEVYYQFFTPEKESQFGVLAIEMKRL